MMYFYSKATLRLESGETVEKSRTPETRKRAAFTAGTTGLLGDISALTV